MVTDGSADVLARSFQVDTWVHLLGGFVSRNTGFWKWIGNRETAMLAEALQTIQIRQPVYVTSLARSGSTLLLEILNRHPDLNAHCYRDYPMLFTPYLWNRYLARTPQSNTRAVERTHGDGIFITPVSPEAFEEILWMAFFPGLHDPRIPSVLDARTAHPDFETFYKDHIRKLLLIRGGQRYLAKGNYNITRLGYLLKIFEDVRFVVPVREPIWHIASLIRQHRRFCAGQQAHPRALPHLQRVGHFEFGLDRRPINTGDTERVAHITELWNHGAEVEGWAHYWAYIHDHLADRLAADQQLQSAVMLIRYENFCQTARESVGALFDHCGLTIDETLLDELAATIRLPALKRPAMFSNDDLATIERLTAASANNLGLGSAALPQAVHAIK